MTGSYRNTLRSFLIVVLSISFDQLTKAIVGNSIISIGPFLFARHQDALGMRSIFENWNLFYFIFALALLFSLLQRLSAWRKELLIVAGMSLFAGGILSNCLDQLLKGYTVDILAIGLPPNFGQAHSFADYSQWIGLIFIILGLFRMRKGAEQKISQKEFWMELVPLIIFALCVIPIG